MAKLLTYPMPAYPLLSSLCWPMDFWSLGDLVWCWRSGNCFVAWTWHLEYGITLTWISWVMQETYKELNTMNKQSHRHLELAKPMSSCHWGLNQKIKYWGSSLLHWPTSQYRATSPVSCGWPPHDFNWHLEWLQFWLHMTFGPSPSITRLTQSLPPNANALGRRTGLAGL